jgi:hypothetical protein
MARIRTIKPEFWSDKTMSKLSPMTRLFFIALWNFADDAGRARALARELAGFAFPYDDDVEAKTVNSMLDELADAGRILLYEIADMRYYQIVNWKHQVINKPTRSRHPAHPDHSDTSLTLYIDECSSTTGTLPEECSRVQGTEDGRRKTETGSRKLEDGNRTTEGGMGETAAPVPNESDQVSVPSVPSFGTGASSVPSPDPVRPQPARHNSDWHLTEADMRDLLKSKWTRQQIEWGVQVGIESGTKPRNARSVLHASILPDVALGKRPGSATSNALPSARDPVPAIDPEAMARLEARIAERAEQRLRAIALIEAREREQQNANPK